MPEGKPAGVPCVQLAADLRCTLFGDARRPAVCASLAPGAEMCRADAQAALSWLVELERATRPSSGLPSPAARSASHTQPHENA
jgi:hypothetical protein